MTIRNLTKLSTLILLESSPRRKKEEAQIYLFKNIYPFEIFPNLQYKKKTIVSNLSFLKNCESAMFYIVTQKNSHKLFCLDDSEKVAGDHAN